MKRRVWIGDVVYVEPGIYIPKNWEEYVEKGEKYDIVYKNDSQRERLLEEYFGGKENALLCDVAIKMGDVGMSMLEPFPSVDEALKWIEENKEEVYFVRSTPVKLRNKFPEIPVQAHPSEYESKFGIREE